MWMSNVSQMRPSLQVSYHPVNGVLGTGALDSSPRLEVMQWWDRDVDGDNPIPWRITSHCSHPSAWGLRNSNPLPQCPPLPPSGPLGCSRASPHVGTNPRDAGIGIRTPQQG